MPVAGSQPCWCTKTTRRTSASQNSGSEQSTSSAVDVVRSRREPARAPCQAPISMPPTTFTMSAHPIRKSERGSASASTAATGRCWSRDQPQSPRTSDQSQRPYCVASESSSPYWARMVARSSGVMPSPSAVVGSPGASWSSTNARVAAENTTATLCSSRRITRRAMVVREASPARCDRDRCVAPDRRASRRDRRTSYRPAAAW